MIRRHSHRHHVLGDELPDLPKKLSTRGAPAGVDPSVGDITYYAPWGNLAMFYKDFRYSTGLVKLGRIDSNLHSVAKQRFA